MRQLNSGRIICFLHPFYYEQVVKIMALLISILKVDKCTAPLDLLIVSRE